MEFWYHIVGDVFLRRAAVWWQKRSRGNGLYWFVRIDSKEHMYRFLFDFYVHVSFSHPIVSNMDLIKGLLFLPNFLWYKTVFSNLVAGRMIVWITVILSVLNIWQKSVLILKYFWMYLFKWYFSFSIKLLSQKNTYW